MILSRALFPNLFTISNLFCGFLAMRYVFDGNYMPAAWLIALGAVLDNMDGKLARLMGKDSEFGIALDSIVDICTFGLVPAVMICRSHLGYHWGLGFAFVYLLCGALRLARFNALSLSSAKGKFFMGIPIPAAAIILTQFVVFTEHIWQRGQTAPVAALMVLVLSGLMVSRIEYDPLPDFRSAALRDRLKQLYFVVALFLVIYPSTSRDLFFPLMLPYLFSGICRWVVGLFSGDEVTQHA